MAGGRDAGASRCSASEVSTSDGSAKIKIVYGVCVCVFQCWTVFRL